MQQIGEGRLDIPASCHNLSVNIYSMNPPGQPGLTFTVNRDRLPLGLTLEDYAQEQAAKVAKQFDGFESLGQERLDLDGRPALEFEFVWHSPDAGPVHQILLTVANGATVLNLTATAQGQDRMPKAQRAEVQRILRSFEFNRPEAEGAL